ncbi:MAG: ribonuclease T2-like [Sclerophora amabilis]|nr:MAG: ribonuclease T2-like [Sclerophora amabilis]
MSSRTPSLRSIAKMAIGSAQVALGPASMGALAGDSKSCSNTQLSCQNTTAVSDLCCFNAPGGQLLLTQFWDYDPATGPEDSWTLHGLWPDRCDGTYDANCDPSRKFSNITGILESFEKNELLDYMSTYWKDYKGDDETFWEHEWSKHGTCISTLEVKCYTEYKPQEELVDYFQKAVDLFKGLPTYETLADAGITPDTSKTYTSAEILAAISAVTDHEVTIGCSSGALNQVWYHYNVRGSLQSGIFEATEPDGTKSSCPATGVKYLPKRGGSGPPTTTTTKGTGPTGTPGIPFTGSGYLNAESGGCLISSGKWFSSGTCATYIAKASETDSGFTLTSSKGACGISSGEFKCGSGISSTTFTNADGSLAFDGSATFYADAKPSGQTQATVYTASHATSVRLSWTGRN